MLSFMSKLFFLLFYSGPLGPSPIEGINKSSINNFITRNHATECTVNAAQDVGRKRTLDYDDECPHGQRHKSHNFFKEDLADSLRLPTLSFVKYDYHARLLSLPNDSSHQNVDVRDKAKETCVVKDICSHGWTLVCICNSVN